MCVTELLGAGNVLKPNLQIPDADYKLELAQQNCTYFDPL